MPEVTDLEPDDNISSIDVKCLYKNAPLKKAVDIAVRILMSKKNYRQS